MDRLESAVDNLVEFSLVKRLDRTSANEVSRSLWMHPLVQRWAQDYMEDGLLAQDLAQAALLQRRRVGQISAICLVGTTLPSEPWEQPQCAWSHSYERAITLQVETCRIYLEFSSMDDISSDEARSLTHMVGRLAWQYACWYRHKDARCLYERAAFIYTKIRDPDYNTTIAKLIVQRRLATFLCGPKSGQLALETIEQVISEQTQLVGASHIETLRSRRLRASMPWNSDGREESINTLRECLDCFHKDSSAHTYDLAATYDAMGVVYSGAGSSNKQKRRGMRFFIKSARIAKGRSIAVVIISAIHAALCLQHLWWRFDEKRVYLWQLLLRRTEEYFGRSNDLYTSANANYQFIIKNLGIELSAKKLEAIMEEYASTSESRQQQVGSEGRLPLNDDSDFEDSISVEEGGDGDFEDGSSSNESDGNSREDSTLEENDAELENFMDELIDFLS